MNITTFGLDIAKNVMQVHWVDEQTGEVGRRALKRSQLAPFFARQAQCRIVLEACGSGHYWGRTLSALGHEVRLIHARHVRPFVRGNKNDAADAQAIWSAAQQPDMRWVPLNGKEQRAASRTVATSGTRAVDQGQNADGQRPARPALRVWRAVAWRSPGWGQGIRSGSVRD